MTILANETSASSNDSVVRVDGLYVNFDTKTVEVNGARVHLTGKEYQMLELLSRRKGTTTTKEMFLDHLYGGMEEPELKIIEVFICKLRKKLAIASNGKNYIETVWGRGYALIDLDAAAPAHPATPSLPLRPERPEFVVGPRGERLTLTTLPPVGCRWVVRRKVELMIAIEAGLLTLAEASVRYRLPPDEVDAWSRDLQRHGTAGLRTTRVQLYRQ